MLLSPRHSSNTLLPLDPSAPPPQLARVPSMRSMSPNPQPSTQRRGSYKSSFLSRYDGGIGSGILSGSGLLSPDSGRGSTSVTPLTPMTPMTTPRTPLQILLGRQGIVKQRLVGGPYRRSSFPQQQDPPPEERQLGEDDEEDQYRESQLLALQLFAEFINTAEATLNDITERESSGDPVLGPGIVRACNDMADDIERVARELHMKRVEASRRLEQVMSDHELTLIEEGEVEEKKDGSEDVEATFTNSESNASLQSHEEYITTLSSAHTVLLDLAAALRAVTQDEAQELGEVALEVARMFVWTLGVVHGNMLQMTASSDHALCAAEHDDARQSDEASTPQKATKQVTWGKSKSHSPVVEVFGEEEKSLELSPDRSASTPVKDTPDQSRYAPQLSPIPASPSVLASSPSPASPILTRHAQDRIRVLWPPLLPAIAEAGRHCAGAAKDHPLSAAALGLTCGPAALATAAFAGPPLLVADWAIQSSYDALAEHTPVIENVEKGAANALQVAKLGLLCGKLVVKQGLSVGERQIERRGGVGKICQDVAGGTVDLALHPVKTAGMAWEGLWWMGGAARDAVGFVKDTIGGVPLVE
ncbi:hypothetical protein ACHAXT_006849 [Thalassiosira profunda]